MLIRKYVEVLKWSVRAVSLRVFGMATEESVLIVILNACEETKSQLSRIDQRAMGFP
jgi:hypothetical protein